MELFFARQPIFDRDDRVLGYELLYRGGRESAAAGGASAHRMTCQVLVGSILDLGLPDVTGGKPAFINASREMLLDGHLRLLPASAVVIEVPAWLAEDAEAAAACRSLRDDGWRLALDGYAPGLPTGPLLELCEFLKTDVSAGPPQLPTRPGAERGPAAVAVRVESREMRARCLRAGFEHFQGNFFRAPEVLAVRAAPLEVARLLELHGLAGDGRVPEPRLEQVLRSAPALAWRLLRMASLSAAGPSAIDSLGDALRRVGREPLGRWLSILLVAAGAGRGGIAEELASAALARARFLELLAARDGGPPDTWFLVGLFSLMDAFLGLPMGEVVKRVDLPSEVRDALLHDAGRIGIALRLARAFEAGDWAAVSRLARELSLSEAELPHGYRDALAWSRDCLHGRAR